MRRRGRAKPQAVPGPSCKVLDAKGRHIADIHVVNALTGERRRVPVRKKGRRHARRA